MRVTDVYMFLLYLSTCHMADYAFKKTQVTDVNITQVIDVSDRRLYVSPLSVHMPHG